ncbi:MAG: amino acid permease [Myxococcota bacterium]
MPEPEQHVVETSDLRRQLGWLDAVAIYVGIILGSGIFVAPAAVAAAVGTWWMAVGLWITGAVIAACGACCYAECGARLPRTGGFYVYYREAYGEPVAFIGGWAALLITYPASLAAIALIFGRYLAEILPYASDGWIKCYGAAALLLAALLNGVGVKAGAGMQRVLTTFKVLALALLCLAALVAPESATVEAATPAASDLLPTGFGAVLMAMVILLWTYDGWSDVTLVSGELKTPGRDLGRTVLVGTLLLAALYVLVQVAVMFLLSPADAASSKRVVADAVAGGLGERYGRVVALLVVVSTFGSLNGIVLTASRLGFAMARDGVFMRWFGVSTRASAHRLARSAC